MQKPLKLTVGIRVVIAMSDSIFPKSKYVTR